MNKETDFSVGEIQDNLVRAGYKLSDLPKDKKVLMELWSAYLRKG